MVPAPRARAVAVALCVAVPLRAQPQPEARVEFARAAESRAALGLGAAVRVGPYVRAGLSVAGDVWRSVSTTAAAIRTEYVMRFTLDPLAEQRWGMSIGGGLGYRERPYLLVVAELEGPRRSGVRPAFQLALGGGVRLAFVLRRAAMGRR